MVGILWWKRPRWLRHLGVQAEADHPYFPLVDEEYMDWAREKGYRVHVWTVDEPAEARRLAELGVHGIITNKPALIREALGR
jgi:glycerophosphoryl diester phosphodiesterase